MASTRTRNLLLPFLVIGALPGCRPTRHFLSDLQQDVLDRFTADKKVIVAGMDGQTVTVEEFKAYWSKGPWRNSPQADRRVVLQELLRMKILVSAAKKAGLDRDPAVRMTMERTLAMAQFDREIEQAATGAVPQAELLQYYDLHAKEFADSGSPTLRHIILKSPAGVVQALRLLKQGRSFASVAQSLSIDKASAAHGGELDAVTMHQLGPRFVRAVDALPEGKISDPVKTPGGYHLILKERPIVPPFAQIQPEVRLRWARSKVQQSINQKLANINVQINQNQLDSVDISKHP